MRYSAVSSITLMQCSMLQTTTVISERDWKLFENKFIIYSDLRNNSIRI